MMIRNNDFLFHFVFCQNLIRTNFSFFFRFEMNKKNREENIERERERLGEKKNEQS